MVHVILVYIIIYIYRIWHNAAMGGSWSIIIIYKHVT